MGTILDVGIKISVPIVVATLLGVSGILWRLNDRMTTIEVLVEEVRHKTSMSPGQDYRDLVRTQFDAIAEKLNRIEKKLDALEAP